MEHEFLPAERVNGVWKQLAYADMEVMVQKESSSGKQTDDVDTLTYEGVAILPITQPMRNKRPAVKATRTTKRAYEAETIWTRIVLAYPGADARNVQTMQHGWSEPDTTHFKNVKVRVVCVLTLWSLIVYVWPDAQGAVYDFALLRADIEMATRHFMKKIEDPAKNALFELDSGFIEVSSKKFLKATVDSVVSEVHKYEKLVLKRCAPYLSAPRILPHAMVIDGKETYAGSYHVWITLPHATGAKFDHERFITEHRRAVIALQWVEPLMLGCMCPDPRAPGSALKHSRASMRSEMNGLSGIGFARIQPFEPKIALVYDSLEDLNSGLMPPTSRRLDAIWATTMTGEKINMLGCQTQDRQGADFYWSNSPNERPWSNNLNEQPWLRTAGVSIANSGTDIRFDTCTSEYGPGHHVAVVMVRKQAWLAVRNKKGVYELKTGIKLKPAGFEFRLFDHFPSEHARDLAGTVVTLAALSHCSVDTLEAMSDVGSDLSWVQQTGTSAMYGGRGPVCKKYWSQMRKALGLTPKKVPTTIHEALNITLEDAYVACTRANESRKVLDCFGVKGKPVFPDTNFQVMKEAILAKLTRKQMEGLGGARVTMERVRGLLGNGWVPDTYTLRCVVRERDEHGSP
jgi:hypothetical protein